MDGKPSVKGAGLGHMYHLNIGGTNHITGTADRLRCRQLSWTVSVVNSSSVTRHCIVRVCQRQCWLV